MARTDPRPNYGLKRRTRRDGYIDVWAPTHPLARRDGYVAEHRKRAYDAGLLTDSSQQIHHLNGDRTDNRLVNLEVLTAAEVAEGVAGTIVVVAAWCPTCRQEGFEPSFPENRVAERPGTQRDGGVPA